MRNRIWMAVWPVLALVTALAARAEDKVLLDGVTAWVDGRAITVSDVFNEGQPEFARAATQPGLTREERAAEQERVFRRVRQDLVEQELVHAWYAREGAQTGISVPDRMVDLRIQDIIRDRFSGDREGLMRALAAERLTYEGWREKIRRRLIVQVLRTRELQGRAQVSPQAVRRYYEERADEFAHPGQVLLRRIVIAGEDADARSRDLLDRLHGPGTDFAGLAREHSSAPDGRTGGQWGWRQPEDLAEPLAEKLAVMRVGGICRVELGGDWYLVKLEARDRIDYQEARVMIEEILRREEVQRLNEQWMDRLEREFHVEYIDLPLW